MTQFTDFRHMPAPLSIAIPLTAVVTVLGSACGDRAAEQAFAVRDSAGITIAASTAPSWQEPGDAWSLAGAPALDLTTSGTGPAHEFYQVAAAVRLSDGRIAIADGGSSEIRLFTSEGAFLGSAGRDGDGPGEFRQLSGLDLLPGDSLMVQSWPARVTILGPDLSVARTFDLDFSVGAIGVLDDTTLVAQLDEPGMFEHEGESRLRRALTHVARFTMDGRLLDTLAVAAGFEEYMLVTERGVASVVPLFGKTTAVTAGGGALYIGSADSLEYRVIAPASNLETVVRVPGYDLRIPAEELAAEREARLGPDPSPLRRKIDDALPDPETRPAYSELLVDPLGYVWAGAHQNWPARRAREGREWKIFAPNGRWLGALHTPRGFTLLDIGRDDVLGVRYDSLDIEHVEIVPLDRQGGDG